MEAVCFAKSGVSPYLLRQVHSSLGKGVSLSVKPDLDPEAWYRCATAAPGAVLRILGIIHRALCVHIFVAVLDCLDPHLLVRFLHLTDIHPRQRGGDLLVPILTLDT